MSFYEGVQHLLDPRPLTDATWNYIVIGMALVFEGTSWFVAYRQFRKGVRRRVSTGSETGPRSACKRGSDAILVQWGSAGANESGLKEVELGTAVHLPLDELELGDLPFSLTV